MDISFQVYMGQGIWILVIFFTIINFKNCTIHETIIVYRIKLYKQARYVGIYL